LQLLPAPPDGRFVQPSNLGQQPIAAPADALGLQHRIPAPLRFVQPTQKHVHAPMQDAIGMRAVLLAVRTLALRDRCRHCADLLGAHSTLDVSFYPAAAPCDRALRRKPEVVV
jgi:hypothetical protein